MRAPPCVDHGPRRRSTRLALLPLGLCLLLVCAARPQPDVVLITIDTLRADHVHAYGYFRETTPHIDRFAADALLFERAVAPMATTLPTHTSLLTGVYPLRHGILSNLRFFAKPLETGDGLRTAAQMLQQAGYRTVAFTSASPLAAETGIGAGFERFDGPPAFATHQRRIDRRAEETVSAAIAWLAQAKRDRPIFLWVHLWDPHDPYAPPPPFDTTFSSGPALSEHLERLHYPPAMRLRAAQLINQYDGEILYTDREVGRLLDALREQGRYDDAVIVLTADHGEGLTQHNWLDHAVTWNEQLFVPLIIRFPGGPKGRFESVASLIDVLPMLAGQAGLPLDRRQFQGSDVLAQPRETALSQREVRRLWRRSLFTLTGARWKYWYADGGGARLFDLAKDPHETRNVIAKHPEVAAAMRQELLQLLEESRAQPALDVIEDIPDAAKEQLRGLGYVE